VANYLRQAQLIYGAFTVLVAEARALQDRISAAIQASHHNLTVEDDNKI